jgi:hypothetical protein
MSTRNQLDLETLGSQPIMPKMKKPRDTVDVGPLALSCPRAPLLYCRV